MRVISGPDTLIQGPLGIDLDPEGNCYVANESMVTVFRAGVSGVGPIRTVTTSDNGIDFPGFLLIGP